jgi:hypothetical protein
MATRIGLMTRADILFWNTHMPALGAGPATARVFYTQVCVMEHSRSLQVAVTRAA